MRELPIAQDRNKVADHKPNGKGRRAATSSGAPKYSSCAGACRFDLLPLRHHEPRDIHPAIVKSHDRQLRVGEPARAAPNAAMIMDE